jgi:hypothetical protein
MEVSRQMARRQGQVLQGLKPAEFYGAFCGTTEVVPCYKARLKNSARMVGYSEVTPHSDRQKQPQVLHFVQDDTSVGRRGWCWTGIVVGWSPTRQLLSRNLNQHWGHSRSGAWGRFTGISAGSFGQMLIFWQGRKIGQMDHIHPRREKRPI